MKKNQEYKTTSNRYVYNRLRKKKLADCSYCKWHPTFWKFSENDHWKSYSPDGRKPNWKLVSKNKKQWMKKPALKKSKEIKSSLRIYFIYGW